MIRTRVGYAGGRTNNPTYHNLGDHTETLQIDYDPQSISYGELLDIFWAAHDPTRRAWSIQYKAVIFFHDEEQRREAEAGRERLARALGREVPTEILPLDRFHRAEDYHQKHRLRQARELMGEFRAIYPRDRDFTDSTAAARVNGYLDGFGDSDQLERELASLGLSSRGGERLRELVGSRRRR